MTRLETASLSVATFLTRLVNLLSQTKTRYSIFCALILSACSDLQTLSISIKDGPGQAVDISAIKDAVPKIEPITKAGNKSPYTQFGKTYYVLNSSQGFRETGIASWYGSKFHGRRTSNGDVYNMYAMTAAHKTLPIPTYVRVTNQENRRSVIVRVNDRGPFHESRIIDLSYVAALKLGFAANGTAKVSVEALNPATGYVSRPSVPKANSQNNTPVNLGRYLQAGAFENHQSAITLANKIAQAVTVPALVTEVGQAFKVWVGPLQDDRELQTTKEQLKLRLNISAFSVKQ